MFCTRCGRTVPEGARFCPNCGLAVTVVTPPAPEPVVPEPIATPPSSGPVPGPFAETPVEPAVSVPDVSRPLEPGAPSSVAPDLAPEGSGMPPPVYGPPAFSPYATAAPATPLIASAFWRRLVALLIDWFLLYVLMSPLYLLWVWPTMMATTMPTNPEDMTPSVAFGIFGALMSFAFVSWVVELLYFALLESSPYQASLGKLAMGLRLTDLEGARISFGRAALRRLARIITNFTFTIGYLMVLWTRRKQTLHDLMTGTLVVRKQG